MRRVAPLLVLAVLVGASSAAGADSPVTRRMYMRNSDTGCPGTPFLALQAGSGEPGCGYVGGAPFAELSRNGAPVGAPPRVYETMTTSNNATPAQVLDATRDIAGNVRVVATSQTQRNAVGQVRVDTTVTGYRADGTAVELGSASTTQLVHPRNSAATDVPFTIAIDDALDRTTLQRVAVTVDIRGWHILTGYHRLNGESWMDLPAIEQVL